MEKIEIGNEEWGRLVAKWRGNGRPGTIKHGGITYKVILPNGVPVFVQKEGSVEDNMGSTSFTNV